MVPWSTSRLIQVMNIQIPMETRAAAAEINLLAYKFDSPFYLVINAFYTLYYKKRMGDSKGKEKN